MKLRDAWRAAGLVAGAVLVAASPAKAQVDSGEAPVNQGGDTFTVGAGVGYVPTYEGSDDYKVIPAALVRGEVSGFNFFTRGLQLYIDVIPEGPDNSLDISFGPVAGLRLNRTGGGLKDPQVRALGKLDEAYEVGAFAGIAKTGIITSAYDNLSVRVAYLKDVGDAHGSYVLSPSIEYGTPLSTTTFVGLGASAEFVGDGYASYYFDVSPAGALASGLPAFSTEGGFKSWSVNALFGQSLSGDLRSGLSLFAIASYTRLQNDFRLSPIVSIAGSPNQWFGAIGIGYTF